MAVYKVQSTNSLKSSTTDNSTMSGYSDGGTTRTFRYNSKFLPDRYGTKALVTLDSGTDEEGVHTLADANAYSLGTPQFLWIEHIAGDGEMSVRCVADGESDSGGDSSTYIKLLKGDFFQCFFDGTSTVNVERQTDTDVTFKYYKIG